MLMAATSAMPRGTFSKAAANTTSMPSCWIAASARCLRVRTSPTLGDLLPHI
jgi:hypothetical protein